MICSQEMGSSALPPHLPHLELSPVTLHPVLKSFLGCTKGLGIPQPYQAPTASSRRTAASALPAEFQVQPPFL